MDSMQPRGFRARWRRNKAPKQSHCAPEDQGRANLDLSVLEDRVMFSGTPLMLDAVEVDAAEDSPIQDLDLRSLFSVDNGGGAVVFELFHNSLPSLFETAAIENGNRLVLELAADAYGEAELSVRATNSLGQVEIRPIHVDVTPINDAPTVGNLQQFTTVNLQTGQTTVNLFAAFDDLEDADHELTFRVEHNSRPDLFTSIDIDMDRGLLILNHAANRTGTAELTIVATDTGHLSVGLGTDPSFQVFNRVGLPSTSAPLPGAEIGLSTIELWTHWYFFEYHNGSYDYSNLDVDKFTDYLMNIPEHMEDRLFTFDIENDYYVNTPEGRDRFAEVLALANQIRPDLDVGMYMFLPERNWHQPVKWMRTLDHLEAGLNSWFTLRADQFEQEFQQWHERNEWYRTEPVSSQYGGTPLADMVDTIYASLYTFYRNDPADPYWRYAEVDANLNTFTIDGPSFDTVEVVRLMVTAGGSLNNGLAQWTDYYVVNASGDTFQLAATPGGTPIDFSGNFTGNIHVGAKGPYWENMWHDPNVIYWKDYAEQNIAEAQKFGKPVYAWISTSIQGIGSELLEPDFLRWQLEILRPLVDGVVLYDMAGRDAAGHMQHGWWTALEDFMGTLDTPAASFTITIPAAAVEVPGPQPNPDPISPPPAPLPPPSPVAVADQFSISGGQPFTFSASALLNNDLNLGVNGAAVTMVANTTHGDLHQISTNLWRYTPDDAFSGIDSFSYRIYNGQVYSDAAVVQIHVQQPVATPSAPQARPDQLEGTEDRPLHFRVADLLSNDLAVNHAQMSFSLVTGPANGTLSRHADGSMIYRPDGNYHGPDQFVYALRSNANGQVISSAMVSIGIDEVNDRPVAVADRLVTREDTPLVFSLNQLLANDIDIESDSLQVEIVQGTQRGQLIDLGHGQYRYVPAANFFGEDQFQYRVYDGSQYSLTTVVAIDVQPINDAPIAREDRFELNEDSSLVLTDQQLLANDTDVDSSQLVLELVDSPAFGTLRRTLQGALVYTPNANFHGSDRFGYRVADGHAVSEIVAVHLTVNPVNDAPIVVDESYSVKAGTVLTVGDGGVLANDRDVDGHAIRAKLLTAPRFGSVTLADDGSFSYRPAPGFSGNDGFEYRVIDVAGGVSIGAARIRVEGVTTPEPILKPILPQVAPQFVLVETNQILTGTKSQSPMFGARVGTSSEDEREQDALLIPL